MNLVSLRKSFMKNVLISLLGILLITGTSWGFYAENSCEWNHGPSPNVPEKEKIGTIAGWEVASAFVGNGGYGVSQATLDEISDLVTDYQDNEFTPRQDEASEIWEWLESVHYFDPGDGSVTCSYCGEIHTYSEYLDIRNTKVSRLNTLNIQIDGEWCDLVDIVVEIIDVDDEDAHDDFIADVCDL